MSNRLYICANCGTTRRAPAVYVNPRRETWDEVTASARWPKHCGQPMKVLTYVQAEAIKQLRQDERVKWIAKGMHVLRQRQHGNRKWKPVTADWQIDEAKRRKRAYFVGLNERAGGPRWRVPVKVRKRRSALEEGKI